ncbi:hypothetical protein [Brevibacillus centrosporus]
MEERVHPELRTMLSVMPELNFDRENLEPMRKAMDENPALSIEDSPAW